MLRYVEADRNGVRSLNYGLGVHCPTVVPSDAKFEHMLDPSHIYLLTGLVIQLAADINGCTMNIRSEFMINLMEQSTRGGTTANQSPAEHRKIAPGVAEHDLVTWIQGKPWETLVNITDKPQESQYHHLFSSSHKLTSSCLGSIS